MFVRIVTVDEPLKRRSGDLSHATGVDKSEAVQPPAINRVRHLANFAGTISQRTLNRARRNFSRPIVVPGRLQRAPLGLPSQFRLVMTRVRVTP